MKTVLKLFPTSPTCIAVSKSVSSRKLIRETEPQRWKSETYSNLVILMASLPEMENFRDCKNLCRDV